jgi:hypothetical protein
MGADGIVSGIALQRRTFAGVLGRLTQLLLAAVAAKPVGLRHGLYDATAFCGVRTHAAQPIASNCFVDDFK